MPTLNILVIPAWFNHRDKTEGIFIHQFCEALQRNGHNVSLLYIKTFSLTQLAEYFKKVVFNYSSNFKIITIKKINFFPSSIFKAGTERFKKSVRDKVLEKVNAGFDVVHFQSLCNNLTPYVGYELARKTNLPYIVTEHYTNYPEAGEQLFKPFLNSAYIRKVFSHSSQNIAVSRFAASQFENYFRCPFISIPNIIAHEFFSNELKPLPYSTPFRMICIAGLTQRKGIMNLLVAFKALLEFHPLVHLTIIGEGELQEDILLYLQLNKLQNVQLLKRLDEHGIVEQLDLHHCLVSASEMETFGLVLAESHLRGRPVVALNAGAVNEIVNNTNGVLCEHPAEQNLTEGLRKVIDRYNMFNQENIRKEAMMRFSEQKIIEQYETIYNKAIHEKSSKTAG